MAEKTVLISQQLLKPIKISKWKVSVGNSMSIGSVILLYDFEGAIKPEQRKLKSTQAGTVHELIAPEGAIIKPGGSLLKLRACIHPTVMKDMCAECGADLRKEEAITTASVPMVHSIPDLKVSEELAQKLGRADGERLLRDRKLVLLVDLDQTLIHTTNDNIPANIKDVYHFQLYGPNSPWYHTRLRPGTHEFLSNVSPMFELHICTFGARNYAHMITMFLDGDQRYFSNRILSRDECFDPTSKKANLKALFPCGDNMVCIIDDREDVWNHASNLIHVKPYHFFQHTGDINAPPGLDKQENDDKECVDLSKLKTKPNKPNGKNVNEEANGVDEARTNGEEVKENHVMLLDEKMEIEQTKNEVQLDTSNEGQPEEKMEVADSDTKKEEKKVESENEVEEHDMKIDGKIINKKVGVKHENQIIITKNKEKIDVKNEGKIVDTINEKIIVAYKEEEKPVDVKTVGTIKEKITADAKIDVKIVATEKEEITADAKSDVIIVATEKEEITADAKNDEKIIAIEKEENTVDVKIVGTKKEDVIVDAKSDVKIVSNKTEAKPADVKIVDTKKEEITVDVKNDVNVVDEQTEDINKQEVEKFPSPTLLDGEKNGKVEQSKEDDLIEIEDPDDYLLHLEDILKRIHLTFYEEYDKLESGEVPDLKRVIPTVRSEILKGTKLVFSGLVPTHIKLQQSKAYQVARSLGALVTQDLDGESTHLVAVRPGTAKVNAGRRKRNLKIVTPDWLWSCAERWEHVDEAIYPLNSKGSKNRHPPPHCSSPEHVPNYPVHETPGARKRTPSGRFMDTINPLMSFSSDDIADMDKEVEDILDDESDESEEESQKEVPAELPPPNPPILDEESSSSSGESLTGEYPRGFKRTREKRKLESLNNVEDDQIDSSLDEFPSTKFRRGEQLDSDLDIGQESNSEGSVDAPDEVDDGEWNMMGAALEREFLSNN